MWLRGSGRRSFGARAREQLGFRVSGLGFMSRICQ